MEMATHPGATSEEQERQVAMAAETPEQAEARVAQERREDGIDDAGPGVDVGAEKEPAAEGEGADEEGLPPLQLEGLGNGQLSLKISGKRPDTATAKMVGPKIGMPEGEFQLGDVIDMTVRVRCVKVSMIDKMNNTTGDVVEREREHQFKVMNVERVS